MHRANPQADRRASLGSLLDLLRLEVRIDHERIDRLLSFHGLEKLEPWDIGDCKGKGEGKTINPHKAQPEVGMGRSGYK